MRGANRSREWIKDIDVYECGVRPHRVTGQNVYGFINTLTNDKSVARKSDINGLAQCFAKAAKNGAPFVCYCNPKKPAV